MDFDELEIIEELTMGDTSTYYPDVNVTQASPRPTNDLFIAKIVVQSFILGLALVGNTFLFLVLRMRKRNFTRMHVFITHLCLADMLVAFFNILPQLIWELLGEWRAGGVMCKFIKFMQVFVMYLSTYVLVLTALDRRRAICSPLLSHTWTYRLVHLSVAGVYVLSAILSIPQAIIFKYQQVPGRDYKDCWVMFEPEWTLQLYITTFTFLVYILPLFILIYAYGSIYYTIFIRHKQSKLVNDSINDKTNSTTFRNGVIIKHISLSSSANHRSSNSHVDNPLVPRSNSFAGFTRAKIRTVKLTLVIIIAYTACWSPFFISQLWWLYDENAPANNRAMVIMLLLASLNSCCNPWIYMAFSGTLSCCSATTTKRCFGHTTNARAQRTNIYCSNRGTPKSNSVTNTPLTQSWSKLVGLMNNQEYDPSI